MTRDGWIKKLIAQLTRLSEEEQLMFVTWFRNIVLRGLPGEKAEELEKVIEEGSKEGIGVVYAIEEAIKKEFQKYEQKVKEGMEKGIEKGIEQTAINLLKMGMSVEQVAQGTSLSCERVQELQTDIKV